MNPSVFPSFTMRCSQLPRPVVFSRCQLAPLLVLAVIAFAVASVRAQTITGSTSPSAFAVSAADLLQTSGLGSVSNALTVNVGENNAYSQGTTNSLKDGTFGPAGALGGLCIASGTVTYLLNTNLNPAGYTITNITTYSGWGDANRAQQNYTVSLRQVGSNSFVTLTTVTYSASGAPANTQVRIDGFSITNVDAIRFDFTTPAQQNGGVGYKELDVFGYGATQVWIPPTMSGSNSASAFAVSAADLLQTAGLGSVSDALTINAGENNASSKGTTASLTDGTFGPAGASNGLCIASGTVTYQLNTNLNPAGYTITNITTYSGWDNSGRADQNYTLSFRQVGSSSFVTLSTVTFVSSGAPANTQMKLDGFSITGVDAIRFNFTTPAQQNGGVGYKELDVFGYGAVTLVANYWDNNGSTAGFGTAAGTWASPTTGDGTQGWSTDGTGSTLPVNYTTTAYDFAHFGNGATGLGAGTITVSGSVTNAGITFASGSGAITLSGGTIYFPVAGTITLSNSSDTINSAIAGASTSPTIAGTGALTLSGANTYSGGTTINGGTLKAGSSTGLSTNSAFSIATGATLDLGGFNNTIKSLATATGTITDSSAPGTGGTLRISTALAAPTAQLFNGSLGLQIYGGGTVSTLNNVNNTHSGGTILGNGSGGTPTRVILNNQTIGAGSPGAVTSGFFGTGAITIGAATSDFSQIMFQSGTGCRINNAIVVNSASGAAASEPGTFRVDSAGNVIAGTINANLANVTFKNFSGASSVSLTNTISGASGLMLLASAGTSLNVTLANTGTANSYAGDTTISSVKETLTLGGANQIPNGAGKGNLIITNGTFNLGGFSETINGLSGSGTVDGVSGTPSLTVGDNNSGGTFAGVIKNTAGNLALTKIGTGTLTLSGTNNHSGSTRISAGTLALSGAALITNTPNIVVASNAIFNVSGLSSTFILASALSSQTLSNSAPGAILNGTNNTGSGTVSLVYDGANPAFTITNGGMLLSSATTFKVNNTAAQLPHSTNKLIAKATTGNVGLVAGTVPAVTVGGGGAASPVSLHIVSGELYLSVNNPPVAIAKSYSVAQGGTITIAIASGAKSLATDADGDTLTVANIGATNAVDFGVAIISGGGASITYTNTSGSAGATDLFSYTVSDGYGGLATNSITIRISPATGANLVSATADGTFAYLTYAGIPGTNYALDWATNVTYPINWTQVQVKPPETNGALRFTNLLSSYPTNDFFRTRYVP